MIACPYCDDYHAKTKNSVAAHASGKRDSNHKGVGYQHAKKALNAQETVNEPSESSDTDTDASQSDTTNGDTDELPREETDPAKEGPGNEDRDSPGDSGAQDTCPSCDGDLIDCRGEELMQYQGRYVDIPDDYYCRSCGQGYNEQ